MAGSKKKQTLKKIHPLLQKLRKEPFRPVLVEDLQQLEPELKSEPIPLPVSKDGYRTLYQNALTFTETDSGLFLTLFEVGFFLMKNGSVRPHKKFREYHGIMKKLLKKGLAEIHSEACREWEKRAEGRFDPNDEDNMVDHDWFDLIGPTFDVKKMLTERQRDILGPEGVFSFHYQDGFTYCCHTPTTKKFHYHTHVVTHSSPSSYFPSEFDYFPQRPSSSSPPLWTVVDVDFINQILADKTLSKEAKIKAIIEHHVSGMEKAVCIGVTRDKDGFYPLIRAI